MQVPCKLSLSGPPKFVSLLRKDFRVESSSYPKGLGLASGGTGARGEAKNSLKKRMFELP